MNPSYGAPAFSLATYGTEVKRGENTLIQGIAVRLRTHCDAGRHARPLPPGPPTASV